jgi:hypothetical protein
MNFPQKKYFLCGILWTNVAKYEMKIDMGEPRIARALPLKRVATD